MYSMGAIFSLLLASCSNELEMPKNQLGVDRTPLQIAVNENPLTKATGQISGTSLAGGAEIGVFVTASDGASYDAKDYNNIKYTATGTGVGQTWAADENTPVCLVRQRVRCMPTILVSLLAFHLIPLPSPTMAMTGCIRLRHPPRLVW